VFDSGKKDDNPLDFCLYGGGANWREVKEDPERLPLKEMGIDLATPWEDEGPVAVEWPTKGTKYYLSGHCPGCKEKDGEIERLKTDLEITERISKQNGAVAQGRFKEVFEQSKEIERLKMEVENLKPVINPDSLSKKNRRLRKEIERLERNIVGRDVLIDDMKDELGRAEKEIKRLQCTPRCTVSVTEEGDLLTHTKLDKILAYLEQWEPAKRGK
jgi:hypothetical protein